MRDFRGTGGRKVRTRGFILRFSVCRQSVRPGWEKLSGSDVRGKPLNKDIKPLNGRLFRNQTKYIN